MTETISRSLGLHLHAELQLLCPLAKLCRGRAAEIYSLTKLQHYTYTSDCNFPAVLFYFPKREIQVDITSIPV